MSTIPTFLYNMTYLYSKKCGFHCQKSIQLLSAGADWQNYDFENYI